MILNYVSTYKTYKDIFKKYTIIGGHLAVPTEEEISDFQSVIYYFIKKHLVL